MRKHGKRRGRTPSTKIGRLARVGIIVAVFALGATAAVSLRTSQVKTSQPIQSQNTPANLNFRTGAQQLPPDPQTGQIRPLTQDEAQRLAEGIKQVLNQSTDGLESVRHADGSISVDLQGHFQNVLLMKRNDDDSLTESCVDNPKAAAAFFNIDPQLVGVQPDTTSPKSASPAPV